VDTPEAPKSLSDRCRALWDSLTTGFEFEVAELETLRLGLEALDRAEQARLAVEAEGAYYVDRYSQPRAHPAIAVEHQSRLDWLKVVRELALTEAVDAPAPKPIAGRYVQGPRR
jgi:hypothetical protein